jgi:lysophospholipase L1-like esterase
MSMPSHAEREEPDIGLLDVEEHHPPEILLAGEQDPGRFPPGTFRKVLTAMATLVALGLATYVVPALDWARPWTPDDPVPFWNIVGREILGEGALETEARAQIEIAQALARAAEVEDDEAPIEDRPIVEGPVEGPVEGTRDGLPPRRPHPDDDLPIPQPLETSEPGALDPFYAALARTEAGYERAITRVTHWGDSAIGNDHVSSTLRAKLQRRFGDAGHGFHLLAKNNPSYRHKGVIFSGGESWKICYVIYGCKGDGHYGLGGTTVTGSRGAQSRFSTSTKTANGRKLSRFEIWYAASPGGGRLRLKVDDDEPVLVPTEADALEDRWYAIDVEDGPHTVTVAVESGRVRAYGVVLERDGPGVVWDGMSQVGAFADRMLNFDPAHLRRQIDHRDPALLVFQFGGNDLLITGAKRARFEERFVEVLRLFRGDDEPRACLVVAPVDHGVRRGNRIVSVDAMRWLVPAMRRLALAQGCAFFDTQAAMGGENAIARWRAASPPLMSGDLAHLTDAGQQALGQMIYLALMQGYREYRSRTP